MQTGTGRRWARKCQQHWAGCLACCLPVQLAALWATAGQAPPVPHFWGLPLFIPRSPGTEHLLKQQGQDWSVPGVARESGASSIATQSP